MPRSGESGHYCMSTSWASRWRNTVRSGQRRVQRSTGPTRGFRLVQRSSPASWSREDLVRRCGRKQRDPVALEVAQSALPGPLSHSNSIAPI